MQGRVFFYCRYDIYCIVKQKKSQLNSFLFYSLSTFNIFELMEGMFLFATSVHQYLEEKKTSMMEVS